MCCMLACHEHEPCSSWHLHPGTPEVPYGMHVMSTAFSCSDQGGLGDVLLGEHLPLCGLLYHYTSWCVLSRNHTLWLAKLAGPKATMTHHMQTSCAALSAHWYSDGQGKGRKLAASLGLAHMYPLGRVGRRV